MLAVAVTVGDAVGHGSVTGGSDPRGVGVKVGGFGPVTSEMDGEGESTHQSKVMVGAPVNDEISSLATKRANSVLVGLVIAKA
jgi:hypothetical protein